MKLRSSEVLSFIRFKVNPPLSPMKFEVILCELPQLLSLPLQKVSISLAVL